MLSIYDLAELFPNCWLLQEPSGFRRGCSSASRTCQELPGPSQHLGCYVGAGVRGPLCGWWPRALVWMSRPAPAEKGAGVGKRGHNLRALALFEGRAWPRLSSTWVTAFPLSRAWCAPQGRGLSILTASGQMVTFPLVLSPSVCSLNGGCCVPPSPSLWA